MKMSETMKSLPRLRIIVGMALYKLALLIAYGYIPKVVNTQAYLFKTRQTPHLIALITTLLVSRPYFVDFNALMGNKGRCTSIARN